LIVGIRLALKIYTRWIKPDLGANPVLGILAKHQRERREICFVQNEALAAGPENEAPASPQRIRHHF
jgi:hypothetical protein